MKLYKNIGIEDLEKIIKNGILPISTTKNYNWKSDNRVNNSNDVVYLFKPKTTQNSFANYGFILLEIETDNAKENEMDKNDYYIDFYDEYIADSISPDEIVNIFIPFILKDRIKDYIGKFISEDTFKKIKFVDMKSKNYYYPNLEYAETDEKTFEQFAKTVELELGFNYFRGTFEDRKIIDLYEIEYVI